MENQPSARLREKFEDGWSFHLGELGHFPRQGTKIAMLSGLTNRLKDEKPPRGPLNLIEEMFIKLATLPRFRSVGGDPVPADKETGWAEVRLPHDWKVDLPFTDDLETHGPKLVTQGYKPSGVGYYRKVFNIPAEWDGRQITLEFDGVMGETTVWVNGACLGEHWSGYTSFAYDLSPLLHYGAEGSNVILLRVDTSDPQGWWYEGAGLYRHVWLTVSDPLRVARWGVFVTTPQVTPRQAIVRVETRVSNGHAAQRAFRLVTRLFDPQGCEVAQAAVEGSAAGLEEARFSQELSLPDTHLWSLETPQLYTAASEIWQDGQLVDSARTPFGIRTVEYTREGLFINGQHTVIKGACVHQDHAGVGIAMPDRLIEWRLQRLKECGCNAYRSAHHPATPELLDACDRLGILVLDENRLLDPSAGGLAELESMLLRDRNHPSIYMWSLSNEERVAGTPQGLRLYRAVVAQARKLDPTRLFTSATSGGKEHAEYIDTADVAGYNYAPDTRQYGLARKHFEQFPQRRFMSTEDACHFTTRGAYVDDPARGWCSSFTSGATLLGDPHPDPEVDLSQFLDIGALAAPERTWQHYLENPFMGGVFIWTGFDYRGEPYPWSWPQIMHQGGIYDLCGFEKDETYFYKAIWREEALVHILPHWNWPGQAGQPLRVRTYTNCDEVELLVNGQSQGRKAQDDVAQVNWSVVYQPGVIEARAYRGGQCVATDRVETSGAPAGLRAAADRTEIHADGADLALVTVEIIDAQGHVVPDASPLLEFALEGPGVLLGLGSGDPACHEPDHADRHSAFHGLAQAIVQSAGALGEICLTVRSANLTPALVKITAVRN